MDFKMEAMSDAISGEILGAYLAGYGAAALHERTMEAFVQATGGAEPYAARLYENRWQRDAFLQGFQDRRAEAI